MTYGLAHLYTGKNGVLFLAQLRVSPVLAQFTCVILFSVLYLAHARCAILSVLSNPIAPIKILSNH